MQRLDAAKKTGNRTKPSNPANASSNQASGSTNPANRSNSDMLANKTIAPTITICKKLHMQVILGYFYAYSGKNSSLIQDMVNYHQENNTTIRKNLTQRDYIRWIYNLHILLLLNHRPWDERAPYIYEAESLAEQHGQTAMLMNIYNLMGIGLLEENVTKAKVYMQKSKELAIELGNKQHEMNATTNLLMFYQYLGDTNHAIALAHKAKAIGETINAYFNEISLVKLYYMIENYPQALQLISEIKPKLRKSNLTITRVDAIIFQYKIIMRQQNVKRAKRLWPFIKKICEKHKGEVTLKLLQCQCFNLLKDYEKTIATAAICLEEKNLTVEDQLELTMLHLEALIYSDQTAAFKKQVHEFEQLVYTKGYFGYLGYAYYFKGLFSMKNNSYIQARVQFLRAKSYFTRVTNFLKEKEVARHIASIDKLSLELPAAKQMEMMNLLTNNAIMFDSIRLVHSARNLEGVCKNITKVLHENLLFDHVYFHFNIDRNRTETFTITDKLQREDITSFQVDAAFMQVLQDKKVSQVEVGDACFYGFPVLTDENEVAAVVLVENHRPLSSESIYYLDQFLQYITPKIEKVIINELVHVDDLTKLYNRNYFIKRLQDAFQRTADFQADLSFIMIDIDDFRHVNNKFGHGEGDRVLEKTAKTIQQSVRSGDIVGRYGGEELIVVLPNTNGEVARGVAHHILGDIRKIYVGDTYQLTASLGVSSVDRDKPETVQELIDNADLAERYAKEHGKNQVVCFWEI
ncbi:MAG: GGDEF domain-containing protein [Bacillus sp. (in: Bacteria)]|nr:GGDEF domain-containing protein [Bacillus sp. (in: firmicutes)]